MSGAAPRALILGASGLVGSALMKAAPGAVVGADFEPMPGVAERIDLTDAPAVKALMQKVVPEVVVVASAWPWVDGCEMDPARSHLQNVGTVANVIAALEGTKARIVYYSTDHVFDGQQEVYDEDSATNPLSVYARHKLESERLLLTRGLSLVARTSYVFGVETRKKNYLYQVVKAVQDKATLTVPEAQAGMPTWATWLAQSTYTLLAQGVNGLVHLTGPDALTKAQWARRICEGLGIAAPNIVETTVEASGQKAPRPLRVVLRSTRHSLIHPALSDVLNLNRSAFLESAWPQR